MTIGYKTNIKRQHELSRFAKDLVRRSRSKCELCNQRGQKLHILEAQHANDFTDASHCLFICAECYEQIKNPKKVVPNYWRFLSNAIWSETPVVQTVAIKMLKKLAKTEFWAANLLEDAYIDEDTVNEAFL